MKRLLFSCSVLLMTGLYLGYFLPSNAAFTVIPMAITVGLIKAIKSRSLYLKIAALLLSCSLIFGIFLIPIAEISQSTDFSAGQKVTLTLRVIEIPEVNTDYCIYVCDILTQKDDIYSAKGKIRLSVQNTENILSFGDVFTASCEITEPLSALNRDGFDYGLHLKTKGIFSSGYITDESITAVSKNNYTFSDRFKLLNMRLCETVDKNFKDDEAIFLKAVLLGEKTDMPPSYYSELKRSGLSHVAAVSGMHLSYIVMILSFFRKIFAIRKRSFAVFTIILSISFMLLTGMSPSVVRATIMVICIFSSDLLLRRSDSLTALGLAAIIIVLPNPFAAFNTSFILSFIATAGILIMAEPLEKLITPKRILTSEKRLSKFIRAIFSTLSVSISAQLFALLPSVFIFREFSLWALPANLLITPFLPFVLGTGFLFCFASLFCMPLALITAKAVAFMVSVCQSIISYFGNLDFGVLHFVETGLLFIFAYFLIIVIILLFLKEKKAYIIFPSSLLLITVIFAGWQFFNIGTAAKVSFINVGQGDCTLITLPRDVNVLIDGGEYSSGKSDPSSTTLNSYLIKNGVKNIDFMVATHANSDHIGGLIDAMDCFDVGKLLISPAFIDGKLSETLIDKAVQKGVPIYTMTTGSTVEFAEQITLTALMPDEYISKNTVPGNNTSLVFRLDCYDTSFLFMGDIEAKAERYMLRLLEDDILDIDVLKVGHHGSDTSTTEAFLKKTTPKFAFIPVGKNDFGHPSGEVLDRLLRHGTTVFRADMNKNVIFLLTTEGISNIIYS